MTLREYAAPIRGKPVDTITTEDLLRVLRPLWSTRHKTASHLRGRLEMVLDAARAAGHRSGENPARWRGHLDHLLSKRQKLTRGHYLAMPYWEVPAFLGALRERPAVGALALEFLILSAARMGEALGATWQEVDLDQAVWTVPRQRMKGFREHRVHLSERALAIISEAIRVRTGDLIFPDRSLQRQIS
jgi:integrase